MAKAATPSLHALFDLAGPREILDACCGGRMWWWDKAHPLAVYMDERIAPPGSRPDRPRWEIKPNLLGDFRAMPFEDEAFRLVLFDPPHEVRPGGIAGKVRMQYGSLRPETEEDDLRRGFSECWRVLARGGTLVFKWSGKAARVTPFFPAQPVVGTRWAKGDATRWFIFYKPVSG